MHLLAVSCLIIVAFSIETVYGFSRDDTVVQTKVGPIRGVRAEDGPYTKFMGIPFAKVNESNVFGDALPYPPFEEIFDAYDDEARCPHFEEFNFTIVGSLDCLHVHIYVPDSATPQNPLPVMIWFFQGRFEVGSPGLFLFGPQYLIRHDVILVTANYRLGPYGFMCLDTPEVPGNSGLKDQSKAIKWVKENIDAFGGDSDKITVFANSAGSMSIGLHLVSDEEKLYDKVIMQSGQAYYAGLLLQGSNSSMALILAESLGFSANDTSEAIAYLSTVDEHTLIRASMNTGYIYRPCVEKEFPNVNRFLSDLAINVKPEKVKGMAIMAGYAEYELISRYANNPSFDNSLFHTSLYNAFDVEEELLLSLEETVRRFYIGDAEISADLVWELTEFVSDLDFIYPTERGIQIFLENEAEKAYLYVFSYDGPRNFAKLRFNITLPGAVHGDDLGYLFAMIFPDMPEPTPEDQVIIDRMTTMWTNFAKYGDPTPNTSELLPYKWQPITKGSPKHYLKIDTQMEVGTSHFNQRMNFWNLFYGAYGKYERGLRSDNEDAPGSSFTARLSPILGVFVLIIAYLDTFFSCFFI